MNDKVPNNTSSLVNQELNQSSIEANHLKTIELENELKAKELINAKEEYSELVNELKTANETFQNNIKFISNILKDVDKKRDPELIINEIKKQINLD